MQDTAQRVVRALIASVLGLVQTGLGQVHLGVARRSLWLLAALYAVMLLGGIAGFLSTFAGYTAIVGAGMILHFGLAIDAGVVAWKRGRERRPYNRWYTFPLVFFSLLGTTCGLLAMREPLLGFALSRIPSGAMEPTLLIGDYILYDTHCCQGDRAARRGDVVVFRFPLDPSVSYVKRVVGVGGDEVEISSASLLINGQPIDEAYLRGGNLPLAMAIVPEGELFVLGDNRERSSDSRVWGTVKAGAVRGRVTCIVYSASRKRFGIPVANPWPDHLASGSSRRPIASDAAEPGR